MRKPILSMQMTVDGFVGGPKNEVDRFKLVDTKRFATGLVARVLRPA